VGRNATSFGPITWSNNVLSFNVVPGTGAHGLQLMVPAAAGSLHLSTIRLDGSPVVSTIRAIKGISYAFVAAAIGR
jgi:hypothetical protein